MIDVGWDNVVYRLGEALGVRLPRRHEAACLTRNEHAWLPVLASRLPVPVPVPVRVGTPSRRYPWPWSIVPWIPGDPADQAPPAADQAGPFARFLSALHRPAPPNAPASAVRGVPLGHRATAVEERLVRLQAASRVVTPKLLQVWNDALAAPQANGSCWLHGDLHARNVLVQRGVITGIIDWGDLTAGDVATDLASAWMLFADSQARADLLSTYGASDALLARAKGWAILFGAVLLDTGLVDHRRHAAVGENTLMRLAEDTYV